MCGVVNDQISLLPHLFPALLTNLMTYRWKLSLDIRAICEMGRMRVSSTSICMATPLVGPPNANGAESRNSKSVFVITTTARSPSVAT